MTNHPYKLTGPIGTATLGLIVLQVDETIEQDFRRLFSDPSTALYISRIPSGAELTPDTIADMESALPQAASLLPPSAHFDAIGYACTSGTTLIGAGRVAELVKGAATTQTVSDPLTASIAALQALNVDSVGIVSPYVASVAAPIKSAFEAAGFNVPATLSFGEQIEARVARIDPTSIRDAALDVAKTKGVEAVFLSCTNLRTLDVIDDIEDRTGLPVVSSNQTLAWHMARAAKLDLDPARFGRLLSL